MPMIVIKHSSDICSYSIDGEINLIEWFAYPPNLYDFADSACGTRRWMAHTPIYKWS